MIGRIVGVLLLVGAGVLVAGAILFGPRMLLSAEMFRAEDVRVSGVRNMTPHAVVMASGIHSTTSVFGDRDAWRRALLAHPLIEDAQIQRVLPRTLKIHIVETRPVAFAATPELRPVDAHGRVLPIDPAGKDLDLPVVSVPTEIDPDGVLAEPAVVDLLGVLAQLQRLRPQLAARVSELRTSSGGEVALLFSEPPHLEVFLSADAGKHQFYQLELVLTDVEERGELPRLRYMDLRFQDQVVVALNPSAAD